MFVDGDTFDAFRPEANHLRSLLRAVMAMRRGEDHETLATVSVCLSLWV